MLDEITKHREETNLECFKLIIDFAMSLSKVMLGTVSLLK